MDVIQEVGAYAGFAAVVGLAVLSALYFSQARDVRRLREWAGRAPERAAEQAGAPEQAAQQVTRPAPSGAVRPIPAVKPAPAAKPGVQEKAAPAGQPATAVKPGAATPAGAEKPADGTAPAPPVPAPAGANAADAKPGEAKPDEAKPTKPGAPAPATPAAAPGRPAKPPPVAAPAPAPTAAARPAPPAVPARPPPPVRSPVASSASQSTAVLPAPARLGGRGRRSGGRAGLDARYIALIVAGVIVLGGAAAFGVSQLGGDDDTASTADRGERDDGAQAPVNPSTVTVSVLNGTTVPGLAAQIGDEVESAGFQRGNVANALDQQRPTSTVMFAEGADREAQLVARRLGIAETEPVDPDSQALGGNASVVVIVGADQTQ